MLKPWLFFQPENSIIENNWRVDNPAYITYYFQLFNEHIKGIFF